MRKVAWIVFASVATLAVLAAMSLAGYLMFELPRTIGSITINGRVLDLQQAHFGHYVLATMGVLLALMIVLVVVPTVVLLALAVPLMLAAFGLAAAAFAAALVFSPLILLLWWLWRRSRNPGTMTA